MFLRQLVGRRRQFRSVEQKRQMVQEAPAPGSSVATISLRHGLNANQLFLCAEGNTLTDTVRGNREAYGYRVRKE
jgi:transposase-like protein